MDNNVRILWHTNVIYVGNITKPKRTKSGAPQLLFNSISAYGFRLNVITLQIPHPFRTFSAYAANYLATVTITMLTVIQESKVSS